MTSKAEKKIWRLFYKSIFYVLVFLLFYFLNSSARYSSKKNAPIKSIALESSNSKINKRNNEPHINLTTINYVSNAERNGNNLFNSIKLDKNNTFDSITAEFEIPRKLFPNKRNKENLKSSLNLKSRNLPTKLNNNLNYSLLTGGFGNQNKTIEALDSNKNKELEISTTDIENAKHTIKWNSINNAELYEITIEAINKSNIINPEYFVIVNQELLDTLFTLNEDILLKYENYRWKYRSKIENIWSDFSEYKYFTVQKKSANSNSNEFYEDIIFRFRFSNYIDEMIVAKYKNSEAFIPLFQILDILHLNYSEENEDGKISVQNLDKNKSTNSIDFTKLIANINGLEKKINNSEYIKTELEYYVKPTLIEQLISAKLDLNLKNLEIKFGSEHQLPMVEREEQQQILKNKNSIIEENYPLQLGRERKIFSGGFFDYSLYGSYVKNVSPYYSIDLGFGNEIFGGDFQINSSYAIFKNKFMNNQTEYRWRYAFLNNRKISSITLGNDYAFGLQGYSLRGVSITNEPLELRKTFGYHLITEKTSPFANVEIYHNNEIIEILEADAQGDFSFKYPFSYGTTILEFKYYEVDGNIKNERKLYQIPITQIPEGDFDYSVNVGKLISTDDYMIQTNSIYGLNDRITTQLGTDLFLNDFKNSSIFSKTSARIFEGYIANVNIAPNAFYEFELNSIFADLANFNIGAKFYEENDKINPTNINSEIDGNFFIPIEIDENFLSIFTRARKVNYNGLNRYDFSLRTYYDINNLSPSIEYNYAKIANTGFNSSYLNFRVNYSFYLPYEYIGGNIIESKLIYNLNLKRYENFNVSLSSTIFKDYRIQLSHNINFATKISDTQLRIVFDLPFFRSNTNISNSVFSQAILGSVNYNSIFEQFDFHNRGMVGRSAAAIRFFLDENDNHIYEDNEKLITDMDVSINSISNKKYLDDGKIILNDLESYYKYELKLDPSKNKNPGWVPVLDKFSFVSDPNQFKDISIPFFEAGVINGMVYKLVANEKVPVDGISIFAKELSSQKITKIKTLSDGSFYLYGIHAGNYEFYLDNVQLEKLKLTSIPGKMSLTVHSIYDDESNEDLIFILK